MAERFIGYIVLLAGYIVSFAVIAGMGLGLPRWFEWRRSLVNRLQRSGRLQRRSLTP